MSYFEIVVDEVGRTCKKCGEYKAWDDYYTRKTKAGIWYNTVCKECIKKRTALNYKNNREKRLEVAKAYRDSHKEEVAAAKKKCYDARRDEILEEHKEYYKKNSDRIKKNVKEYQSLHRDDISKRNKTRYWENPEAYRTRSREYAKSPALYKYYGNRLLRPVEEPTETDEGYLEVNCFNSECSNRFTPTNREAANRVAAIEGRMGGEFNLYCSQACKDTCPVYRNLAHMRKDPTMPAIVNQPNIREVTKEFSDMVLKRDEYTCQKCGSIDDLEVHHIISLKESPMEQLDLESCVTLCKECHKFVHRLPGCTYSELRDIQCEFTKEYRDQVKNINEIVKEWLNK